MTIRSRRLIIVGAALLLLFCIMACVFSYLIPAEHDVFLSGQVILRDSYLLSGCWLPTGEFVIWSYDFKEQKFHIHAHRPDYCDLLRGSTKERITWHEFQGEGEDVQRHLYSLRSGSTAPEQVDFASIVDFSVSETKLNLNVNQAHNNADRLYISTDYNAAVCSAALVDLNDATLVGSMPASRMAVDLCYLGPSKEFIICYDGSALKSAIIVLDAATLKELHRHSLEQQYIASELRAISDSEFVITDMNAEYFHTYRLGQSGDELTIEAKKAIKLPAPYWRKNVLAGVRNMYNELRYVGLARIPTWFPEEVNMPATYNRNNLVAWQLIDPPVIRVAKEDDQSKYIEIPSENASLYDWPFQLSDDASMLVTISAANSFQIWRMDFPKTELWQECRLHYDAASDALTLEQLTPASAP